MGANSSINCKTLRRLGDDFKIDLAVEKTPLSHAHVDTLYTDKPDNICYILRYLTQIRLDKQLPDSLMSKPCCMQFQI